MLLCKGQKCLVSEMSFSESLILHVVHFKQANIVDTNPTRLVNTWSVVRRKIFIIL